MQAEPHEGSEAFKNTCDIMRTMPGYPNNYQPPEKRVRYTEEDLPPPPPPLTPHEVFVRSLPVLNEELYEGFSNKNPQIIVQYL